ncbi:hypothetical protein ACFTWF_35085 [Rhodococcus sp. NPDC056960]|uniref:hypothetical protein n=1 Tax=Rhodococcus sp. NPDC056960 TaxID=3345982 RepID=UPI00363F0259
MSGDSNTTPTESDRPNVLLRTGRWWLASPATLWASVGFLLVIVVAGAILIVRGGGEDRAAPVPSAAPTPSSSPTTEPEQERPGASGFGPPSADWLGRPVTKPNNPAGQVLPQTALSRGPYTAGELVPAPAGVMWQQVGPSVLPFSTSDGPARTVDGLATGYTRTPQGAALAALQALVRVANPDAYQQVVDRQILHTPELEQMLAHSRPEHTQSGDPTAILEFTPRPSAFRVTGWIEGEFAALQYALPHSANGPYTILAAEAVWVDGDWKLRLPDTTPRQTQTTTLAGWTLW